VVGEQSRIRSRTSIKPRSGVFSNLKLLLVLEGKCEGKMIHLIQEKSCWVDENNVNDLAGSDHSYKAKNQLNERRCSARVEG
jgi:hypothetical protein